MSMSGEVMVRMAQMRMRIMPPNPVRMAETVSRAKTGEMEVESRSLPRLKAEPSLLLWSKSKMTVERVVQEEKVGTVEMVVPGLNFSPPLSSGWNLILSELIDLPFLQEGDPGQDSPEK